MSANLCTTENIEVAYEAPVVKIARMNSNIVMPKQAHDTDAGFDLSSTTRVDIPAGCSMLVGALRSPETAISPGDGL